MSDQLILILAPLVALIVNSMIQLLGVRYRIFGYVKSVFSGFLLGFIILIIIQSFCYLNGELSHHEYAGLILVNILIYGFMSLCYFAYMNLGVTSLRIRMLKELSDSPKGLIKEEILQRYNSRKIISVRIERLMQKNQIRYENERYVLSKKMLFLIARFLESTRNLYFGKKDAF